MAAKLVQTPMAASHVFPSLPMSAAMEITRSTHRASLSASQPPWKRKFPRNGEQYPFGRRGTTVSQTKVAEQSSSVLIADEKDTIIQEEEEQSDYTNKVSQLKSQLYNSLQGINRGIFGTPSAKKTEIEDMVKLLEFQNPTPEPTSYLEKLAGNWKLVYSTITILGVKRTKLGLRDFITLGDFWQIIDVAERKAVNVIKFSAKGFSMLSGQLHVDASFKIASKSRVDISYNSSSITPEQLINVFQKNYDILLSIFNPNGWLEITYVDDSLRIGRDDKGNIFILERSQDEP